jgi:signal transduction histidine kinase
MITDAMRPQAGMRRVRITVEVSEDLPNPVVLDQDRFQQVLLNLITNAIKFTTDGTVTISCRGEPYSKPDYLYVEVTDTGIGIPQSK